MNLQKLTASDRHEEGVFIYETCRLASTDDLTTTVKGRIMNFLGFAWSSHKWAIIGPVICYRSYVRGELMAAKTHSYLHKFFRTSVQMQLHSSLQPQHFGASLVSKPANKLTLRANLATLFSQRFSIFTRKNELIFLGK